MNRPIVEIGPTREGAAGRKDESRSLLESLVPCSHHRLYQPDTSRYVLPNALVPTEKYSKQLRA